MYSLLLSVRALLCSRSALALIALGVVIAGCGQDEISIQCHAGEMPAGNGDCQPAGVPPEACGPGSEADMQAGCVPILPEGPCPSGQMAVPGDLRCREVAPCGTTGARKTWSAAAPA